MGWFSRKRDPVTERAKLLNKQIAALEAEIHKLAEKGGDAQPLPKEPQPQPQPQPEPKKSPSKRLTRSPRSPFAAPEPEEEETLEVPPTPPAPSPAHPRLRSTAMPHGPTVPLQEPIFEEVGQNTLRSPATPTGSPEDADLGVRKNDLSSSWERVKTHFRGPVASNPKLVHYLSAGSIQGLRPLRYEKRVARNRFLVSAAILLLVLWGVIWLFAKP